MRAYEEVADFIASRGPREVAEFRPSAQALDRVSDLLQKEKTSELNSEERRELDHYEDLELLMNLARARAQQLLLHDPRLLAALDEAIAKADATPGEGHLGLHVRARLSEGTAK